MEGTLGALWRSAAAEERDVPAYLVRDGDGWEPVSWREAADRVHALGQGLRGLGIGPGDRFAILGRTSLEWVLLDWALLSIGVIVVPIYPTSSDSEIAYILENAQAVGAAVENPGERATLPVEHVLAFSELDDLSVRDHPEPTGVDANADDVATIIYTSGTTGPPKGCLLTHHNYVAVAERIAQMPDFLRPGDRTVLFLPLAHTFGRLVNFAGARIGFTIAFCPDVQDLPAALEEVRPHFLPSVPRLYEKTQAAIKAQVEETAGLKRRLADWALGVGSRVSALEQRGASPSGLLTVQHRLADRLVLGKVRKKLGGRLRFGISGAAPLGRETLEFFHGLGLPVFEAYGLTECLPVAVNTPDRYKLGTVGAPFPGCEVAIAEDGEILARGEPLFRGYLGDESATSAVIDEAGWFHTGDIGLLDAQGFLTITDRKKDLIATAGGKKISPQNLELLLQQGSRLVSHALIVGDRRPYIAALITVNEEELAASPVDRSELSGHFERVVAGVNEELARPEQIKRFAILPRDFSPEEDEITPTLKVKRAVCARHFEAEIEALYEREPQAAS